MPPLFMMLPPREKKGSASREKESMPEKQRCAAVRAKIAGSMLNSAVKMDAMPMPAEMGTPASSMTKKEPNSSNVACATIMRFLLSFLYALRRSAHTSAREPE